MKDLYLTEDGDILLDPNTGDIMLAEGNLSLEQRILFHLKTTIGDYTLVPKLGASLEQFIGRENTEATGNEVKLAVEAALQRDASLSAYLFTVEVAPISAKEIEIAVFVQSEIGYEPLVIVSGLSLNEGFVYPR